MKEKIAELELLLKKAIELADSISDEAFEKEIDAKDEYRSLRHSDDEEAEEKAYNRYRYYRNIKTEAERLETSINGLRHYNDLFK